ncbi:MAG TPA: cupredoxin domain-containing protein [Acidimicrobiia bacterium]|nr:cupredoxin domain-containing protein [Acidimicrobiia bacterium]
MTARRSHRRRLWLSAVLAVSWLVPAGAGSSVASAATCSPNGTQLSITALDGKFDKDCLAAPANQAFTIDFNNLDRGIPHNVAIYQSDSDDKPLFKGELIEGPKKTTYSVPALPAGNFVFRCDPHPDMHGTFIVAK